MIRIVEFAYALQVVQTQFSHIRLILIHSLFYRSQSQRALDWQIDIDSFIFKRSFWFLFLFGGFDEQFLYIINHLLCHLCIHLSVLANDATQFLAHAIVGFRHLLACVKQMLFHFPEKHVMRINASILQCFIECTSQLVPFFLQIGREQEFPECIETLALLRLFQFAIRIKDIVQQYFLLRIVCLALIYLFDNPLEVVIHLLEIAKQLLSQFIQAIVSWFYLVVLIHLDLFAHLQSLNLMLYLHFFGSEQFQSLLAVLVRVFHQFLQLGKQRLELRFRTDVILFFQAHHPIHQFACVRRNLVYHLSLFVLIVGQESLVCPVFDESFCFLFVRLP